MFSVRRRVLAPAIAMTVAAPLAACSDDSAGPDTGADVEDVAEEGADEPLEEEVAVSPLLGQTVTVSAEIEEVIAPSAIRIGEEGLLVISSAPTFAGMGFEVSEGLVEDDVVLQVTGPVVRVDVPGTEEELGFDWDDEALAEFEGENAIVATEVDTLAGETVTVAGEIQDVLTPVSFRLGGVGWQVVVLDAEQATVDEGDFVQVQGAVRELNIAELEEELESDLEEELYEPYEGQFVLVAESVNEAARVSPVVPSQVPAVRGVGPGSRWSGAARRLPCPARARGSEPPQRAAAAPAGRGRRVSAQRRSE